jgi:hypothetical protein
MKKENKKQTPVKDEGKSKLIFPHNKGKSKLNSLIIKGKSKLNSLIIRENQS